MSSFTEFSAPLRIEYDHQASEILGRDHWRVTEEFRYDIGSKGSGQWVTVPAGYLTDGASVPRPVWSIIPPWGEYGQAVVVHDILCEYLTIMDFGLPVRITRRQADDILLEAMTVLGVPEHTRRLMHAAVAIYREVKRIEKPSQNPVKRQLEAHWA